MVVVQVAHEAGPVLTMIVKNDEYNRNQQVKPAPGTVGHCADTKLLQYERRAIRARG